MRQGEGNFSFVVCEDIDLPEDLNLDSEQLPSDTPPLAQTDDAAHDAQASGDPGASDPGASDPGASDPGASDTNLQPLGVAVLINKKWWRNAIYFSFYFAPKCIKPALISLAMMTILIGTMLTEMLVLQQSTTNQPPNLAMYVGVFFLNLLSLVVCCGLLFWSVGLWLARLIAFAAAFSYTPQTEFLSEKIDVAASKAAQLKGLQETEKRKGFIAKFWSCLSLLLFFPMVMFGVPFSITALASAMAQPGFSSSIPLPQIPKDVAMVSMLIALLFLNYTMLITFVGIIVSATTTKLEAWPAAMETMKLSHKQIFPLSLITAAMLLLSVLIMAPQEILQRIVSLSFAENNVFVMFTEAVWQAASSVVVLTLTLAPMCEYLRVKPE